jgi:hypothetical protein
VDTTTLEVPQGTIAADNVTVGNIEVLRNGTVIHTNPTGLTFNAGAGVTVNASRQVTATAVATLGNRNVTVSWTPPGLSAITATRTIDVVIPPLSIPTTPGETFEDPQTGTSWRVLVPENDPRGGIGNALIITEYVHLPGTRYHDTVGFTLYQSADASTTVRNWWNDNGVNGSALRSIALDYEFQNASGGSIARTSTAAGAGIEVERGNDTDNSTVGAVPVNTNVTRAHTRPLALGVGTPEAFVLSTSEANEYFASNGDRSTGRIGAIATNTIWWLRSSSFNTTATSNARHAVVSTDGSINSVNATVTGNRGFRPALWIRP